MPTIAEQLAVATVTDDLNRAENPLGVPWIKMNPAVSSGKCQTTVGQIGYTPVSTFAAGEDAAYWSTSPFSTAGEKFIYGIFTISRIGGNERQTGVWLCRDEAEPVETQSGYLLRLERKAGANEIKFTIERWVAGAGEVIKELTTTEFIAGAKIALVVGGGKVYLFAAATEGGTFEEKMQVASATHTKGYSGVRAKGTGEFVIKDFRTGTFTLVETPTVSTVALLREMPPTQVALRIDAPSGQSARWAEDEPLAENSLSDWEHSTEIPGGYKDAQCSLGRSPQVDFRDIEAFGEAKAYISGVEPIFEGSLDKAPNISGDQPSISPTFLGYQALLDDDQGAQVGFIDCDLSKWGEPSLARRQALNAATWNLIAQLEAGFQDSSAIAPGITANFSGVEKIAGRIAGNEAWYYGGGPDIGAVMFDFHGDSAGGFHEQVLISKDDQTTAFDASPNYNSVTALNQNLTTAQEARKYAVIQAAYTGGFIGQMTNMHSFRNLKVIGRHGLTVKGAWPNVGFTAKPMLEYLIKNFGSPLEVDPTYIEDEGFLITQSWYGEGSPLAEIVRDIVKYELLDWFVYQYKRFEHRKPGSYGRFWKGYVAPSNLNELGIDSQRLWRRIKVLYTDVDGSTRTAGPMGSGCNIESSHLEITDPDHPAVRANRTRRDVLDLQGIGTPETAISVGKRFLEEANLLNRSGSATLSGYVLDNTGILWPAAVVKAGDWFSPVDAADPSYRKIVNTSYRGNDRSVEIDVDSPSAGLEALLERLQSGLISLGVG